MRIKTPTVVVVLSEAGVERSLILAPEDDVRAQERGYLLLARITPQLASIDNALRAAVSAAYRVPRRAGTGAPKVPVSTITGSRSQIF